MAESILVTGATGNVGREIVRQLQAKNVSFCTAGRRPLENLPWRYLDFNNSSSTQSALIGVQRVFLVRPPEMGRVKDTLILFLRQARRAGVEQVVLLSVQGAENNPLLPHHQLEQAILELKLGYTFLRASFFMQNLSTAHRLDIARDRELRLPAGSGQTAFVDCRDIAQVASLALTQSAHLNQAYELTGSEALTYEQVAAVLTEELGIKIRYRPTSLPAFIQHRLRQGDALPYSLVMGVIYTLARLGQAGHISPVLAGLLGRAPRRLSEFVRDYRECWQSSC